MDGIPSGLSPARARDRARLRSEKSEDRAFTTPPHYEGMLSEQQLTAERVLRKHQPRRNLCESPDATCARAASQSFRRRKPPQELARRFRPRQLPKHLFVASFSWGFLHSFPCYSI